MTALIYVTGYIAAYLILKRAYSRGLGEWTQGLRMIVLMLSIFSWLSFLAGVLIFVVIYSCKNNKPVKW
jgi:hypothetical protein